LSVTVNDFPLKLNDTEIVESKEQFENSKNKEKIMFSETQTTTPRATLCFSSTGEDVEYLQRRLNGIRFGCLVVDGIFGVATEESVKKFQKYYGLTVDGIVGSQTWAKLETIDI